MSDKNGVLAKLTHFRTNHSMIKKPTTSPNQSQVLAAGSSVRCGFFHEAVHRVRQLLPGRQVKGLATGFSCQLLFKCNVACRAATLSREACHLEAAFAHFAGDRIEDTHLILTSGRNWKARLEHTIAQLCQSNRLYGRNARPPPGRSTRPASVDRRSYHWSTVHSFRYRLRPSR